MTHGSLQEYSEVGILGSGQGFVSVMKAKVSAAVVLKRGLVVSHQGQGGLSHQGGLPSLISLMGSLDVKHHERRMGWPFIRVVFHIGVVFHMGWSFIGWSFTLGGLSSLGWSFTLSGLSSGWSFTLGWSFVRVVFHIGVVFHQSGLSHRGGLLSGWSFTSGWSFVRVVFHIGWSFTSGWSFISGFTVVDC